MSGHKTLELISVAVFSAIAHAFGAPGDTAIGRPHRQRSPEFHRITQVQVQ